MKAYLKPILSLTLGICAYCFWALPYRAALSFQEQMQLFLLDPDYFWQHMRWPGGIATYAAEFLVQFYNNYWIGAAVIALLYVWLQVLTYRLSDKQQNTGSYLLSFVPVMLLWLYMGDCSVMPAFMVAIVLAMLGCIVLSRVRGLIPTILFAAIGLPLLYWIAGPSVYIAVIYTCIIAVRRSNGTATKTILPILIAIYAVAAILVISIWVPYPLQQQLTGINYYRYPKDEMEWFEFVVMLAFAVTPALIGIVRNPKISLAAASAIIIACICLKPLFYDSMVYEIIDYDYLVRTAKWQAIIDKAEKQQPRTPMTVCATNMALAATDQLCERAFDFYQGGPEGLLPQFKREPNSSMMTGEAYYQLGLTNTAQRFYFEAMEAIPNFNKSSRCLKRIAETNIINGQYEVAKKYLRLLQKTMFYNKWATRAMAMIDEGKVDQHPVYGKLRHQHITNDFLFSTDEIDKILGQLYLKSPDNTVARQYLLLYPLLQRDINRFMQYMQVVQQTTPYMPSICQEGVAFAYMKEGQPLPNGLITPVVADRCASFAKAWTGKQPVDAYKNTLWYYLMKGNE